MNSVDHHGRKTTYERTDRGGSDATICFVHGSGGSRTAWTGQRRLADSYPVVTLDLSGHGESEDITATPGYSTLSAYADDVIAVAKETGSRVVCGSSLGGAVTLHIAIEREEFTPDALILTGTGAKLGVLDDFLEWLEHDVERAIEFLHEENLFFHDVDQRTRTRSIEHLRDCDEGVLRRDFLTCHRFDVRDTLDAIDVPTLVVYGAHDRLTPPWYHEYLSTEISDTTLVEIDDAAHLVMLERPTAFNDAIRSFLDDIRLDANKNRE